MATLGRTTSSPSASRGGRGFPRPCASTPSPSPRRRPALLPALLRPAFDPFLGVGPLTLDYLEACGVPPERRGLFPYAVDVEHFRERSGLSPEEREAARARLGLTAGEKAVLSVAKLNP